MDVESKTEITAKQAVIGIDPGLSGAVALYIPSTGRLEVWRDFKELKDISNALGEAVQCCEEPEQIHFFIEFVHAFPGQGVTSMFNFGKATGVAVGSVQVLEELYNISRSMYEVQPQKWQMWIKKTCVFNPTKIYRCKSPDYKNFDSRLYAIDLFPRHEELFARVKDHGSADAVLIAYYGAHNL